MIGKKTPSEGIFFNMTKSKNEKKCGIILNYEYPPIGGGAGSITEQICTKMAKLGFDQILITSWFPGLKFVEQVEKNFKILRVPTLRLKKFRASILTMASYVLMAAGPLILHCVRNRIDFIHAHFLVPVAPLAFLANKIFNIPYIITMHGGDVPNADPATKTVFKLLGSVPSTIIQNAKSIVSVSESVKKQVERHFGIPVINIQNGINKDLVFNRCFSLNSKIRLLFAGRLVALKNVDVLLNALNYLSESLNWQLDIYGDGIEKAKIKKMAKSLKNQIVIHGWKDEFELINAMRRSDIFIQISDSEGLSISTLQAMASGCSLVLSRIGANLNLLEDGVNGHFCECCAESVAEAITSCTKNLKEFGQKSIEKVSNYYIDENIKEYAKIYDTISNGNFSSILK